MIWKAVRAECLLSALSEGRVDCYVTARVQDCCWQTHSTHITCIPRTENCAWHVVGSGFSGTSLLAQWLRLWAPNAGGSGSIPGQRTRPHMSKLKRLHAATKIWCGQINKKINILKGVIFESICKWKKTLELGFQGSMKVNVAQSHPTLWDPMNYVHGNLQASILEWVAFPFSRGSSQPRDQTQVSHIAGRFATSWATREAQEYWSG